MDLKSLVLGVAAALMFAVGAVFMKPSAGLSRWGPTTIMLALFVVGAGLNTLIVHRSGEVGPAYLMVLGCETLLAYLLGVVFYSERVTAPRLIAVVLILIGTVLLGQPNETPTATPAPPVVVDGG